MSLNELSWKMSLEFLKNPIILIIFLLGIAYIILKIKKKSK